jgi:hypothetical protein
LEKRGFEGLYFVTAHTVDRAEKAFPVFLALAVKRQGAAL